MQETYGITFQYYQNIYGSKTINNEQTFDQLLPLAVRYALKFTNPAVTPDFTTDMAMKCICGICEILFRKKDLEILESEKFDTFEKKYKSVEWDKEILELMAVYLPDEYMYRGVEQNA